MAKRDKEFEARMQGMIIEHDAEVRAKAIDDFVKEIETEYDNDACPNVTDYLDYKISLRDLFRIAEQMKGGAGHEIN